MADRGLRVRDGTMAAFGKPDQTGRSSGKLGGRERKLRSPPKNEPWAWLTRELLSSPAWRALSVNGRRLIDFLLIEHCNHAARENGNLMATHEQLRHYGLTGDQIRPAIEEAGFLGLLRFERGGRWAGTNAPSRFRLTFYVDRDGNPATNDWKRLDETRIGVWKDHRRTLRAAREKRKATPQSRSTVLREVGVPNP